MWEIRVSVPSVTIQAQCVCISVCESVHVHVEKCVCVCVCVCGLMDKGDHTTTCSYQVKCCQSP